jgi:hypothetical protein
MHDFTRLQIVKEEAVVRKAKNLSQRAWENLLESSKILLDDLPLLEVAAVEGADDDLPIGVEAANAVFRDEE